LRILERIEDQIDATKLPLVAITLAAVPCPDTPVILTLHWHGFVKEKLADVECAQTVSYTPIPSSALQVNDRWRSLIAVDLAAMEAALRAKGVAVARLDSTATAHRFYLATGWVDDDRSGAGHSIASYPMRKRL